VQSLTDPQFDPLLDRLAALECKRFDRYVHHG
jgi:hypothetical protein